jgi:hypothetical protein
MQEDNFYLILPSNGKSVNPGENKIGHYFTHLPQALQLSSNTRWEVALVEICYPFSWQHVHFDINEVTFSKLNRRSYMPRAQTRARIPAGYYNNIQEIVDAIEAVKPSWFKGKVEIKDQSDLVQITLNNRQGVTLHPNLAAMLGFQNYEWIQGSKEPTYNEIRRRKENDVETIISKRKGDIRAAMYNIFVYSNIVQETLVGDTYVPLLRTVPLDDQPGQYVHKTFERPHYIPLNSTFIPIIEIRLTDDTGDSIRFDKGKVITKLHLRIRQSLLH